MDQRSPEWFAARLGKVTASRVADIMASTKTGPAASRKNYMAELVCERLTGVQADRYSNAAMQWGVDQEAQARMVYEFMRDVSVEETGLVDHPSIQMFGASPDGLIGTGGLIEIKCPNTATHIETLLGGSIDRKYVTQMQVQMACTGRSWCDFMSFDPRLPPSMQIWISRVVRDDDYIAEIESAVLAFLVDLDKTVFDLKAKYGDAA